MWYPYIHSLDAIPLSEDQNILFLWMPKCAGTSVRGSLGHFFSDSFGHYNNNRNRPHVPFDHSLRCATFYHSHLPSLIETGFISKEWVEKAFIFTYVRNPWDRMVSLFHYLIQMKYQPVFHPETVMTFEGFIERVVAGDYPRPCEQNLLGFYQANRLTDWLRPKGVWLPHFIGKVENIQADWRILNTILGIKQQQLNHRNKGEHGPYQKYYIDKTRVFVAEHFAEEIDIFEHTFD